MTEQELRDEIIMWRERYDTERRDVMLWIDRYRQLASHVAEIADDLHMTLTDKTQMENEERES